MTLILGAAVIVLAIRLLDEVEPFIGGLREAGDELFSRLELLEQSLARGPLAGCVAVEPLDELEPLVGGGDQLGDQVLPLL